MSGWPDPARAHAVVIGTSEYAHKGYARRPSAAASAEGIRDLILKGSIWKSVPAENIISLIGKVTLDDAAAAIQKKAAIKDLSALLVYICGHGQTWTDDDVPDKSVHFALSDSHPEWPFGHLPFRAVRMMLRRVIDSAHTVLIIDCCYADGAFLGATDDPPPLPIEEVIDPLDVPGVCTLVSTKSNERAMAIMPDSEYTAFSGTLIDIIRKGIPGPEEYLTPDSIFKELHRRLVRDVQIEPDMRGNGIELLLCPNTAHQQVQDTTSYQALHDALSGREDLDVAPYVKLVAAGSQSAQPGKATGLIKEFSAKRAVGETVRLATMLRSAERAEAADLAIREAYQHRSGAELADLVHLVHQQGNLDIAGVLDALSERPAREVTDLRAGLRGDCGDCLAAESEINGRILRTWPTTRLNDLLKALY